jgi:hypothetical protein
MVSRMADGFQRMQSWSNQGIILFWHVKLERISVTMASIMAKILSKRLLYMSTALRPCQSARPEDDPIAFQNIVNILTTQSWQH